LTALLNQNKQRGVFKPIAEIQKEYFSAGSGSSQTKTGKHLQKVLKREKNPDGLQTIKKVKIIQKRLFRLSVN
jgi:hypothetical protein